MCEVPGEEYRLTSHRSAQEAMLSFAFKSTPEWQDLMRAAEVEISVVFHSETSADLYANDELHSSIVISECDQTDIYSASDGNVLEYEGTALRRMTIMSQKAALPNDHTEKAAPHPRREASHLDSADIIASKVLSTDALKTGHGERERKRARDTQEAGGLGDPKKAKTSKKNKKNKENEKRSRYVKLPKIPCDCHVGDLLSFLRGLDGIKMFVTAHQEPEFVAVHVECRSPEIASLVLKRSGETITTKSNKKIDSKSRGQQGTSDAGKMVISVNNVILPEAAWAKAVGARLDGYPGHVEIGNVWKVARDAFAALMNEESSASDRDDERELAQSKPRGGDDEGDYSGAGFGLLDVVKSSPSHLLAMSERAKLRVPHPDTVYYSAVDGMYGGARGEQVSYDGHYESGAVASLLPLRPHQPPSSEPKTACQAVLLGTSRLGHLKSSLLLRLAPMSGVASEQEEAGDSDFTAVKDGYNVDLVARLYALYTRLSAAAYFRN